MREVADLGDYKDAPLWSNLYQMPACPVSRNHGDIRAVQEDLWQSCVNILAGVWSGQQQREQHSVEKAAGCSTGLLTADAVLRTDMTPRTFFFHPGALEGLTRGKEPLESLYSLQRQLKAIRMTET